jgi:hypothetical protein
MQRLDVNDYNEAETVTIRVALTVPYYGDTEFRRVDGEIEHNGEFYRLVKQKLQKDTLYIVCIKDVRSKHIQQALAQYVKTFTDQAASESQTKSIHSFIKDYVFTGFGLGTGASGWSLSITRPGVDLRMTDVYFSVTSPPPESFYKG